MLGEPAFVASHHRSNAKRKAFLAQQRIAAVARAIAPDLARLGEVHDVLVLPVARPWHVALARRQRRTDRVNARDEFAIAPERLDHRTAHARHDAHAGRDVRAVGQLDADVRDMTADRPHRKRHHVQCPPAHAALEESRERCPHFGGRDPVVRRAGVVFALAAYERAILDPRDVGRIRTREVAAWTFRGIELDDCSGGDHFRAQALVFFGRATAPDDAVGTRSFGHLAHPGDERRMAHPCGGFHGGGEG